MKSLIFLSLFTISSLQLFAQTKVKITYDANGSRIKREIVSLLGRPGAPADSSDALNSEQTLSDAGINNLPTDGDNLFKVYPNPANSVVHVAVDRASVIAGTTEVRLVDIQGRQLYTTKVNSEVTNIDIAQLADGNYYIILNRHGKQETAKMVKQTTAGR